MDYQLVKEIINCSLKQLVFNDNHLLKNKLKEECLNHKLANYIEHNIKVENVNINYDIDIEYDKNLDLTKKIFNDEGKEIAIRPDILVHKRDSNDYNLIAIEAKKQYSTQHDIKKIMKLLKHPYNYSFGFIISYLPRKSYVRIKYFKKSDDNEINIEVTNLDINNREVT